ncbi:MAG: selenocysteine-specific translation elongation factor, partial [Acidobacteria bacterium]|nr:selenocysteine-specific translation elongation factor [Acidobacteriota bacterium]
MKHLVVGTAGHIDHGKSTLVEALTGIDPDRLQEEKARGITIDLGFAPYRHGDTQLAFVDVPGHERFVRNMLAGASGMDCVLLVIAADESVMPQTREHFDICRLLGVGGGLVALTKADLVDEETLELVRLETRELIAGSFLDGAALVPVSARTGAGLDDVRRELAALSDGASGRADSGIPRLPVDRTFSVKGFGTVVTGTQASGVIEGEGELTLMPAGRRVKVRGLQVHGEPRPASRAGQRVAVNLAAVGVDELQRGDTLTTEGGLCASRRFDGRLTLLDGARPLKYGARVRFHQGTSEIMARLAIGAARAAAGKGGGAEEGMSHINN